MKRRTWRTWLLAGTLLAVLSIGTGRAHAQLYTTTAGGYTYSYPGTYPFQGYTYAQPYSYIQPYAYSQPYGYTWPYAGSYSYTTPGVAPTYGYNSSTSGSSPTMAGYRYLDDYAAGRHLPLAKPWMAPLR